MAMAVAQWQGPLTMSDLASAVKLLLSRPLKDRTGGAALPEARGWGTSRLPLTLANPPAAMRLADANPTQLTLTTLQSDFDRIETRLERILVMLGASLGTAKAEPPDTTNLPAAPSQPMAEKP